MKKLIRIALCVLLGIVLIWVFTPQIPAVTVYGESEIYTREDRQSAARLISDTVARIINTLVGIRSCPWKR